MTAKQARIKMRMKMETSVAWQDYQEGAAEGQRLHFHGCDGQISQDKDEEDEAEDGDFHGLAGLP